MKTKNLIFVVLALIGLNSAIIAQQKYAVLIAGDNNAVNVPVADRWNQGNGMGQYGFDEFWNDTYLFWEMLYKEKGYTNENILVCYDDGVDLYFPEQSTRYQSYPNFPTIPEITDMASTKSNIQNLFTNTLASLVTQDDFLYVWIMSHGGNTNSENNGDAYFYSSNGQKVYDYELANWMGNVNANRVVFHISVPKAGGFINNLQGENRYIYTSCNTYESSYRADNIPVVENEVINGITYNHGEFNFHTYSAANGETPDFSTTYNGVPLSEANADDNMFLSFGEAADWNEEKHTTAETPLAVGEIEYYSAADYPTIFIDDFTEDAIYRGIIGADRFFAPYDDEIYLSNNSITIASNAKATFFRDTKLVIDGSGVMTIEDDVELNGYSGASGILDFNEIYIGENVIFRGDPEPNHWGALVVAEDKTLELLHVTFENCYLVPNTYGLRIIECDFIRSGIRPYVQNISVSHSTFLHSWIDVIKPQVGYGSAQIDNCTITDPTNELEYKNGIKLWAYDDYSVTNCYIDGFKGDGIHIITSGFDIFSKHRIENNTILNSAQQWWMGALAGLSIIDCYATIHNNHIESNDRGIVTTWHSNVSFYGDPPIVTQRVINNTVNQIWSTDDSFPYKFKYNELHSTTNPPYHIVYMSVDNSDATPKDISYNYWGANFDPSTPYIYFCPVNGFKWQPIWIPGGGSGSAEDDELLFESAQMKVDNENYVGAESDYLTLIETYPESKYAVAALKELYRLEKVVGNDYDALQAFYETNPTVQTNESLKKAGYKLAIDCEVRDENYIAAIAALEEYIINPSTDYADSLFAVNELGYIYYLMEYGSGKSSHIIESPSTKFVSNDKLNETTNYHLSLLFKDEKRKESLEQGLGNLKAGELMQNIPNPFKGNTQIWYKLESESTIELNVYNYTGQLIRSINEGTKTKGNHYFDFDATGLKNGIYFYSIIINGQTRDSKKMTIMK